MLTAKTIENLRGKDKKYRVADRDGLSVLVQPSGVRLFQYRYRIHGKEKIYSYGQYPSVSLADAREAHEEIRRSVRSGEDPMAQKKNDKAAAAIASGDTFELVAGAWHKAQSVKWSPGHAEKVWESIKNNLLPSLGNLPVSQITTPILLRVIKKIEERGASDVASRSQQRATSILGYAVQHGFIEHNPGLNLRGVIIARPEVHRAAVGVDEVGELLWKIEGLLKAHPRTRPLTQLALKLVCLTFLRSIELRGARWSEFDFKKREWRVPGIRDEKMQNGGMKMKIEHIVPLSDQAVDVLNEIKKLGLSDDLVFPLRQGSKTIMSENTMNAALNKMGYKGKQTVHGFRTIASTILNRGSKMQKWNKDAIERQLAHSPASESAVRDAYNRYEYLEERVDMMQWYADRLDVMVKEVEGATVIEFKRA